MSGTTIGVKLDDETRERLRRLGDLKDRSSHWVMKTAIQEYLGREEASERERIEDEERWQRYAETGAFIDNGTMMNWLDELAQEARKRSRG